jgi:hypothetical protein
LAIVVSLEAALAVIATVAGAVKVAPLMGDVILTVGGTFAKALTVMLATLEVALRPVLSMAMAVSE